MDELYGIKIPFPVVGGTLKVEMTDEHFNPTLTLMGSKIHVTDYMIGVKRVVDETIEQLMHADQPRQ